MPYSVSPRWKLITVGLKPSWNLSTRMPTRLAARKCPSSCTNTSTPSTKANARSVVKLVTSDLQFYPAGDLLSALTSPAIHGADSPQRGYLCRSMRRHRALDHVGNHRECQAALEE